MSWLRNSPLRNSLNKQWSRDSPPKDADPGACYDSFCKHWQQTNEIIKQTRSSTNSPVYDDIVAVINHIDQMITLLLVEFRSNFNFKNQQLSASSHSPCLEYLLSENLLEIVYDWSLNVGRYTSSIRLELIKLFELIITFNGPLIGHEPIARPLLKLLELFIDDIMPFDIEKKLIMLLNSICVALMQNLALLDVFFQPHAESEQRKFIIFTLLLPHMHREGPIGQQARDAILLCMALSKKNDQVGIYLSENSNVCPVLATGISGLYSLLPRKLEIEYEDWHRLTPDDVNDIPSLDHLMQCFEFCNAVAQITHMSVQKQLLEYLYQGFLVPVLGPALLQTSLDESVAATAYLDLFFRTTTNPGLLRVLIKFLLEKNYDDCRILDTLIQRISTRSRLCIVTLAFFETLVDLNCEDIMLELCLSALSPCSHVMLSQRRRLRDFDLFGNTAKKFLSLRPNCCLSWPLTSTISSSSSSNLFEPNNTTTPLNSSSSSTTSTNFDSLGFPGFKPNESLYGNYFAYLYDARQKIVACNLACANWSSTYDGVDDNDDKDNDNEEDDDNRDEDEDENLKIKLQMNHVQKLFKNLSHNNILDSVKSLLDYDENNHVNYNISDIIKLDDNDDDDKVLKSTEVIKNETLESDILSLLNEQVDVSNKDSATYKIEIYNDNNKSITNDEPTKVVDQMFSMGESSGYESLAMKNSSELSSIDDDNNDEFDDKNDVLSATEEHKTESVIINKTEINTDSWNSKGAVKKKLSKDDYLNSKPNIGIFLDVLLKKLESMTSNNLYVNLHLTGLISRLAIYHQPLLQSFLLNPSLVFQPSIRSLFQILASLKHKMDKYLSKVENVDELVRQARMFLINREFRIIGAKNNPSMPNLPTPVMKKESISQDSFIRNEPKRRSLTSSLTQIFKFGNSSPPQSLKTTTAEDLPEQTNDLNFKYPVVTPTQHVVICAVIMDEWLKELAAITQEHCVLSLNSWM
ncbi:FHIP family protein GJ17503 isoform X1 [Microplitis mediator]|uniref:FHIP family protein GJ17503 isoform X1 n=1 Tax=Microplitis mediator TaxID=375433 RepID=UPI0025566A2F|nr:FHIP family protein GJ17503 isoform X1 [Microplitis mediator]